MSSVLFLGGKLQANAKLRWLCHRFFLHLIRYSWQLLSAKTNQHRPTNRINITDTIKLRVYINTTCPWNIQTNTNNLQGNMFFWSALVYMFAKTCVTLCNQLLTNLTPTNLLKINNTINHGVYIITACPSKIERLHKQFSHSPISSVQIKPPRQTCFFFK